MNKSFFSHTDRNTLQSTPVATFVLLTAMLWTFPVLAASDSLPELDCVIEPSEIVDIGSATAGVLESVAYDRGDLVKKHEVVARLESSTEKAAAELARVRSSFDTGIELRRTSAEFFGRNKQRSGSLTEQNAISQQQLDQLETEAQVAALQVQQEQDNQRLAELEYRRAQEALRRRAIKSPINGVVVERYKAVGEYVEDTAIMRVAQLDPLHVETIVPVTYMGQIKPGMQAQVTPIVPGQAAQYAVVSRIDRVADAASGTFGVRLTLDNPAGEIATGVRCALQFDDAQRAVSSAPGKKSVPVKTRPEPDPVVAVVQPDAAKAAPWLTEDNADEDISPPLIAAANVAKITTPSGTTDEPRLIASSAMTPTSASLSSSSLPASSPGPVRPSIAAISATTDDETANSPAQCFEAGPIDKHATADELIAQLTESGNDAWLREIPGEFPGQFFVLTEKSDDRAAAKALLADLANKGIKDTHLLTRGDNALKISLGLFSSQKSAQRLVKVVAAKGFDVHVAPRDTTTLFLDVASRQQQDANDLRRLLGAAAPERIKEVPCTTLQAQINLEN